MDCSQLRIVAHPLKRRIGADLSKTWDKNKNQSQRKRQHVALCKGAASANGIWVDYWWEKLGEKTASRKLSFMIQVPGQPYQVTAGIYNDVMTVEELSKSLQSTEY